MSHNAGFGSCLILAALAALFSACLAGQQLTVSLSTNSPAAAVVQGGTAFTQELAALTFSASGGAVMVDGITFTVSGTGDFANDLDPSTGLSTWLDDGDGSFNSTLDTNLGATGGASPTMIVNFSNSLTVPDSASVDLWIACDFLASAGGSVPDTFEVSVANTGDVSVQAPATVNFGMPAPNSATLSLVIFFVTTMTQSGHPGQSFELAGSGLTTPISISIGGVDRGTGVVNGLNTMASGWTIPDLGSSGGDFDVVVTTSLLGPITLAQTFRYSPGSGESTDSSCSTTDLEASTPLVCVLAALAALLVALRVGSKPFEMGD